VKGLSTFILILLFVAFVSNSCKRGIAVFTLSGTITDETFSGGLNGAKVKLYKVPIGTSTLVPLDSLILPPDGKYQFTFPRDKIEKYVLIATKENYFEIIEEIPFSVLNPSETNTRNFGTKAKSWVEMRFINTTVLPGEIFRFMKINENNNCLECCPGGLIDLVEQSYYSKICINNANSLFSVDYWIINGNSSQYGHKEATPSPFDTSLILVTY